MEERISGFVPKPANDVIIIVPAWARTGKRKRALIYLTPDLLSDHLFRIVGRATTSMPNITIAYI